MDKLVQKENKEPPLVAVAMSGGIDSSVTAQLLLQQGYQVMGITLKVLPDNFDYHDKTKTCCSPIDIQLAAQVCAKLSIPHLVLDVSSQFKDKIIDPFFKKYLQGVTPNPCVECNPLIKFGLLLQEALRQGASYLATGHYCIVEKTNVFFLIRKGIDHTKDQSYMLWRLTQEQLKMVKFPLGGYHKKEIKKMGSLYFPFLNDKPESQDICFISHKGYQHYLAQQFGQRRGNIINSKGEVLGHHPGYPYFTIGQRKGLGISHSRPLYVTKIIPEHNQVVVGEKEELAASEFSINSLNFIAGYPPAAEFKAEVMIRYNFVPATALIKVNKNHQALCRFDAPQLAVTPGQSAVFYQGDLLLGGGIID